MLQGATGFFSPTTVRFRTRRAYAVNRPRSRTPRPAHSTAHRVHDARQQKTNPENGRAGERKATPSPTYSTRVCCRDPCGAKDQVRPAIGRAPVVFGAGILSNYPPSRHTTLPVSRRPSRPFSRRDRCAENRYAARRPVFTTTNPFIRAHRKPADGCTDNNPPGDRSPTRWRRCGGSITFGGKNDRRPRIFTDCVRRVLRTTGCEGVGFDWGRRSRELTISARVWMASGHTRCCRRGPFSRRK